MLVAKIEIWPFGEKGARRTIGHVKIGNMLDTRNTTHGVQHRYTCWWEPLEEPGTMSERAEFWHDRALGAPECTRKALVALQESGAI